MMDDITEDSLLEALASSPPLWPRAAVPDRYEIRGRLGEGGFGVVYDAYDTEKKRFVALKTLSVGSTEVLRRLKNEFRLLADVHHRNIVQLYELDGPAEGTFLTMERLDGAVPFDVWARRGERELREALRQVIEGLNALHLCGVLHRDLKPSNVLVDAKGRVVLLDFGLARKVDDDRKTSPAGTLAYMAPEQCVDENTPPSPAIDVYAIGVMLFRCLTGCPPFEGTPLAVAMAKTSGPAPSVRELAPNAPEDLVELVRGLLETDPKNRPTVADLLDRPVQPAPSTSFVGRRKELEELGALTRAADGTLVEVLGPSGIGKTALLEEFVRRCRGVLILQSRCHPREHLAFKAFDELLDQLAKEMLTRIELQNALPTGLRLKALCTLFPVFRQFEKRVSSGRVSREQGLAGVRELLVRLTAHTPVLLIIDDLQWADGDSAALMMALLGRPGAPGLTVLASRRSDEVGILVEAFDRVDQEGGEFRRERLRLGPLTEQEARGLGAQCLEDQSRVESVARRSKGHPLLLQELARDGGDGSAKELFFRRIELLSEESRKGLSCIALAGYPLPAEILDHVCPPDAQDEVFLSGLARTGPAGVRVFHDQVAEALTAVLTAVERERCHLALAEASIAEQQPVGRVADHLRKANDERAPGYLLAAAQYASASHAHGHAAVLYTQLLERDSLLPAPRHHLEAWLAHALSSSGQPQEAALRFEQAAETTLRVGENPVALLCAAAKDFAWSGEVKRAEAILDRTLRSAGLNTASSRPVVAITLDKNIAFATLRTRLPRRLPSGAEMQQLDVLWSAFQSLLPVNAYGGFTRLATYRALAAGLDVPVHQFRVTALSLMLAAMRGGYANRAQKHAEIDEAYARVPEKDDVIVLLHAVHSVIDTYGFSSRQAAVSAQRCWEEANKRGQEWGFEGLIARMALASAFQIMGDVPRRQVLTDHLLAEVAGRAHPTMKFLAHLQALAIETVRAGHSKTARWHQGHLDGLTEQKTQQGWQRMVDFYQQLAEGDARGVRAATRGHALQGLAARLSGVDVLVLMELLFEGLSDVSVAAQYGCPSALRDARHVVKRIRRIDGLKRRSWRSALPRVSRVSTVMIPRPPPRFEPYLRPLRRRDSCCFWRSPNTNSA